MPEKLSAQRPQRLPTRRSFFRRSGIRAQGWVLGRPAQSLVRLIGAGRQLDVAARVLHHPRI